jgi:chloramphenicol O-acetyltransferase type A
MKYIDMENWKRKEHFAFFYRMNYPQYNICANIDVTRFLEFARTSKLSFYYTMIYAVTRAANEIENFKYRIRDGKVVLHDIIHPSFTDMNIHTADDLFKIVTVDMNDNLTEFVQVAEEISRNQKTYFDLAPLAGRDDFLYITCIPWVTFTQLSHTISLNRNESAPRISWGKYFRENDKVLLPFSVQVHHALVDGFHVGKYIENLQTFLNTIHS